MRKCQQADVEALVSMMLTTTSSQMPNMRGDRTSTREFVKRAVTSKSSLLLVADDGFLIALEAPLIWFEKRYTQILLADAESKETLTAMADTCIEWWLERRASMLITYSSPTTTAFDRCLLWHDFINDGSMFIRRRYPNGT